jgi:hypothetical protein
MNIASILHHLGQFIEYSLFFYPNFEQNLLRQNNDWRQQSLACTYELSDCQVVNVCLAKKVAILLSTSSSHFLKVLFYPCMMFSL